MIKLTDRTKTVEITMTNWTGNGYTPDWSHDFFEVGALKTNEDGNAYIVSDVDYCISCAKDWEQGRWDGDEDADPDDIKSRCVTIEVC